MPRRGEHADVGAELDDDGAHRRAVDAGDGHQELDAVLALIESFAQHGVVVGEALGGVMEGVQLVVQREAAGLVEPGAQRVAKAAAASFWRGARVAMPSGWAGTGP